MERIGSKQTVRICGLCRAFLTRPIQQGTIRSSSRWTQDATTEPSLWPPRSFKQVSRRTYAQLAKSANTEPIANQPTASRRLNLDRLNAAGQALLKSTSIPAEQETLQVLKGIEAVSQHVADARRSVESKRPNGKSPTSAMLALDSRSASTLQPTPAKTTIPMATVELLSSLAYKIVTHPPVFINSEILSTYVSIQSLLLRPTSFPQVFDMYAKKPLPRASADARASTANIQYKPQNPKALSSAVPLEVAERALAAAIEVRDLALALDIISTTVCTPAFRRNKMFRKALPSAVAAALAPVAVYTLASKLAAMQSGVSQEMFVPAAFLAMFTYVASLGTIGYVVVTTSNDHMERVTWIEGTPLWDRWVREEERAALDKVALAWGFNEKWRWGEEEGEEWEELKEYCGVRKMILDKVSLMEGME